MVTRHNKLRDCIVEVCRRAHIGVRVAVGNNLTSSHSKTRPADILIPNCVMGRKAALDVSVTSPLNPQTVLEAGVTATAATLATEARKHKENNPKCSELGWVRANATSILTRLCGKPAAFDLTVVSPLNPTFISEAGRTAGSAAVAAELRKHSANDAKCSELGWTCIPLVAESYGAWGSEAVQAFSRLASYLATRTNSPKSKVVCSLYGRLNLTLVRANARALLLRCGCSLQEGDISSS
ncbi:hypothetical protein EMCRGX_G014808 [Ephydatia muelleri]